MASIVDPPPDGKIDAQHCPVSIQWLDDTPPTPCILPRGHEEYHRYETPAEHH